MSNMENVEKINNTKLCIIDIIYGMTEKSFIVNERKRIIESIECIGDVKGKNICLVDEAIFTGFTLKIVCSLLKETAAYRSTSPVVRQFQIFSSKVFSCRSCFLS